MATITCPSDLKLNDHLTAICIGVGAKYLTEAMLPIRNIAMFQDLTSDVFKKIK